MCDLDRFCKIWSQLFTAWACVCSIKGAVCQAIQVPKPYKYNKDLMLFYEITEVLWLATILTSIQPATMTLNHFVVELHV